ncbi:Gfo/Idh/MocA family oxidoreductase [bacterium]|nr:Gfo/Idh/MocA family oxidoreductase [bacterium]
MSQPNAKLRAAVVGTGYLGRFHAQKYAAMDDVELVAVVDVDEDRARAVAAESGGEAVTDLAAVLDTVDIASVVVPNIHHYAVARPLLDAGVHVMLEKPLTNTLAEADDLIDLAAARGVVLQAGHLERFNPAVAFLRERSRKPLFIEAHRLGGFKNRATDVDVVLDLMIHDIDIVLALVGSEVAEIRAAGYRVLTPNIDIANARIQFASGCVVNLTASRVSLKDMRKIRVFEEGLYLSADCATRENVLVAGDPKAGFAGGVQPELKSHGPTDNLNEELLAFVRAVRGHAPVPVSGAEGRAALAVAIAVNEAIRSTLDAPGQPGVGT